MPKMPDQVNELLTHHHVVVELWGYLSVVILLAHGCHDDLLFMDGVRKVLVGFIVLMAPYTLYKDGLKYLTGPFMDWDKTIDQETICETIRSLFVLLIIGALMFISTGLAMLMVGIVYGLIIMYA
jgi:hypothetical protein